MGTVKENDELQIIDILRKLIAQEKSERALVNLAAAETFAAKAAELLIKHKLDMSEVEFAEEELNEPVASEVFSAADMLDLPDKRTHDNWIGILLVGVSSANFCKVIRAQQSNTVHIVGRTTDRSTTVVLFEYLSKACIEMALREADDRGLNQRRSFISSFKLGFASAIQERLRVKHVELKETAAEQGLMRIDQMERATAAKVKEIFPELRKAAPAVAYNRCGMSAGRAYGHAIGINSTKRLGA